MRGSWLLLLALAAGAPAGDCWWQEMFVAEDRAAPPRPEMLDPLSVDDSLDAGADRHRGLLWMSLVPGTPGTAPLEEVFRRDQEIREANDDALLTLVGRSPVQAEDDLGLRRRLLIQLLDLDQIRSLVTRYQESQGLRPQPLTVGHTTLMPALYDSGEPVQRWVDRHIVPVLPDMLVRWGRSLDVTHRVSWSFSQNRFGGDPTLLISHMEESVKEVDIRVLENLSFEVGVRRELLDNRPEDDFFAGNGGTEPFASLMWKF